MTFKIKHKRGPASALTAANLTLSAGELAFETDTRRFKLGDGTTAWSSLSYVTPYVTATDRILGRSSAGAGSAEEITCTAAGRALLSGADAAAQRTTLSVQPTASPAFTGAATVTNDGNVVPLTITNTGTANSFVVNDASGDTTPFVIDAAGGVGVGGSPSAIAKLHVLGDLPASASTQGFRMTGEIPSAATSSATSYISFPSTQAASFTCAALYHYRAFQGTFGAGSAVTSQFGYHADASLTGATNNYGFYSDIASGTGRFNFYANGTAANYFAGPTTITSPLTLTGTVAGNVRQIKMQTSGVDRWQITPSFDAETGSNAGSNFHITRWSDAGSFMGTPLYITRSTGVVNCESGLTIVSGQLLVTAGSGSSGSYKPGIAVSGDDDTGLQQVGGANTISLVTAGSERVRVGSNGRVQFFANSEKFGVQLNNGSTGNGPFLGSDGADILTISTSGGAERMRVDAGGNLGIGVTPAASTTSNVQASGDITLYGASRGFLGNLYFQSGWKYAGTGHGWGWIEGSGSVDFSRTSSSGTAGNTATLNTAIRINSNSEVLIGTTTDNGAYLLQVNSQIYATNATIATSDARFKTNVEALTDATAVIEALRPVAFDFIPHAERNFATERQVGLIAQETQSALAGTDYAGSVVAQCGDHLGLAYEKLVPVLIRALQESNARIAALEERINA